MSDETTLSKKEIRRLVFREMLSFIIANGFVMVWMYLFSALFSWSFSPTLFKTWTLYLISSTEFIFVIWSGLILYGEIRKFRRHAAA